MPESTNLPMAEGGRRPGGSGISMPLLIGGGVAFIVLLLFLNKQSSGDGSAPATTAAGASINAALGSIQEQNMNILGSVGKAQTDIQSQIGTVDSHVIAGDAALATQLGTVNNSIIAGDQSLMNLIGQGASYTEIMNALQGLTGNINGLASLLHVAPVQVQGPYVTPHGYLDAGGNLISHQV